MSNKFIVRDDDINYLTSVWQFKRVNDLLKSHKLEHYCAVLFKDLFLNYEVAHLLVTEPNITIAFHGTTHKRYADLPYAEIVEDIKWSLDYWRTNCERRYGVVKEIKAALPTWHLVSDTYKKAAEDCGLKLDTRKEFSEGVYMMHYWSLTDDESFNKFGKHLEGLCK